MNIVPITMMKPIESLEELNSTRLAKGIEMPESPQSGIFSDILNNAIDEVRATQEVSMNDSINLANGSVEDMAQVLINSDKAATAIEFTTEVSTRVINAYKEIMNMNV